MSTKHPLKRPALWLLVFGITASLCWLSLYAFRFSWLTKPEEEVVQQFTACKKFVNEHIAAGSMYDADFIRNNFILINTTEDAGLAQPPVQDEGGVRTTAITDREKMAQLFQWLAANDSLYTMAVCDLRFIDSSTNHRADSNVAKYINLLLRDNPKIIFAGQYDDAHGFDKSVFTDININPGSTGDTHYDMMGDGFIEYKLSTHKNRVKSLPLLLYEKVHGQSSSDGRLFKLGDREGPMGLINLPDPGGSSRRVWNSYVPELLFDAEAIDSLESYENSKPGTEHGAVKMRLGTATESGGIFLSNLCLEKRGRILFIGAFGSDHGDTHETLYGRTDGSVILLNIYYGLASGKNNFSPWFLVFLFLIFFALSVDIVFTGYLKRIFYYIVNVLLLLFIPHMLLSALGTVSPGFKVAAKDFAAWVEEESHYFILLLAALVCNTFFNRIINVVVLALAVFILHKLFKYLYGSRSRQFKHKKIKLQSQGDVVKEEADG